MAGWLRTTYRQYKDRGLMVVTLMAENDYGEAPSVDELKGWANQYIRLIRFSRHRLDRLKKLSW